MGLSNLLPGVSVSDIPGNRPEDEEDEAFWLALSKHLSEEAMDMIGDSHDLQAIVLTAAEIGRTAGYREGIADGRLELYQEQYERAVEKGEA